MSHEGPTAPLPQEPEVENGQQISQLERRERLPVSEFLNEDNRSLYERMSDRAKTIAHDAYEGLYKVPGVNRLVGKMEIAYNSFWSERHEEKAIEMKNQIGALDMTVESIGKAKEEMESAIAELKRQNIPGVESIQLKLKDLEKQKHDALNKKDRIRSKFEARDNKVKLYTNERDKIANKLIEYHNERIGPMEKELDALSTCRDREDLSLAVLEAKQQDQIERLKSLEERRAKIEEALRTTGSTESEIAKFGAIKILKDHIENGYKNIRESKDHIRKRIENINKKITKVDARANPHRDRREEYIRIKEQRPIPVKMEVRQRSGDFRAREDTTGHTRKESEEEYVPQEPPEPEHEEEEEVETKNEERIEVQTLIAYWNADVQARGADDAKVELLNPAEFAKVTTLTSGFKLEAKDFKRILASYYKLKKIPVKNFDKKISEVLGKLAKVK